MNLKLEIPNNLVLVLVEYARQAGVPIEAIVVEALTDRLADLTSADTGTPADEFSTWLREWAHQFPRISNPIDDSRDSIYSD